MKITYDPDQDILYIELQSPGEKPIRNMDGFKDDLLHGLTYLLETRIGDIYPDHDNPDYVTEMTVAFEIHEASRVLGFIPPALTWEIAPPPSDVDEEG